MKKKSTSQSAFFNLRVLVGLFVALAGVSLALLATQGRPNAMPRHRSSKYKVTTRSQHISPLVPPGFDCSKIASWALTRWKGFRAGAIMIFCGQSTGGSASPGHHAFHKLVQKPDGTFGVWRHGRVTWLPARRPLRTLFSRRRHCG
jgi:hypothetical protein